MPSRGKHSVSLHDMCAVALMELQGHTKAVFHDDLDAKLMKCRSEARTDGLHGVLQQMKHVSCHVVRRSLRAVQKQAGRTLVGLRHSDQEGSQKDQKRWCCVSSAVWAIDKVPSCCAWQAVMQWQHERLSHSRLLLSVSA